MRHPHTLTNAFARLEKFPLFEPLVIDTAPATDEDKLLPPSESSTTATSSADVSPGGTTAESTGLLFFLPFECGLKD